MNPVQEVLSNMSPGLSGIQVDLMTAIGAVVTILLIVCGIGVIAAVLMPSGGPATTSRSSSEVVPDHENQYRAYSRKRYWQEQYKSRYEREIKKGQ